MDNLVQEALSLYNFNNPTLQFIRHNENMTYKVVDGEQSYALRIHKPVEGFSLSIYDVDNERKKQIESEMNILDFLSGNPYKLIQKPVINKKGDLVSVLSDGSPVTVLKWIEGNDLNKSDISEATAMKIGYLIAWLHQKSDSLINHLKIKNTNHEINRYRYDQQLLKKVEEQIIIAVSKDQIKKEHESIILNTLRIIEKRMDELESVPDMKGFVHADLSPSNLIVSDKEIAPIDFSLSGYGYFYMDIGMILSNYNDHETRVSIKKGYEDIMGIEIPVCYIDAFFSLGVLLFIACQHDKASKEDWFNSAVVRWCSTIFTPIIEGKPVSI
ncbi:MAG: phosphotransferase [Clostridia bacterium]|nr:phosphotransferase [Clostridia bacterium]